jgi:hypothetical protein
VQLLRRVRIIGQRKKHHAQCLGRESHRCLHADERIQPSRRQQIATITFVGSGGATITFPLIGGQDIRDYNRGGFANTLNNGISGVQALNAFTCVDPATCLGSGGTGNVNTGARDTYVVDEQDFSLGATFAEQTLTEIIITDTDDGPTPIVLGVTVGSGSTVPNAVLPQFAFGGGWYSALYIHG